MIIDVHYHWMTWPGEKTGLKLISTLLPDFEHAGLAISVDEVLPVYRDYMSDPDFNKLVSRMDKSGIAITAVNVIDLMSSRVNDEGILSLNKACAVAANKHKGRLIPLAGIDPRRANAPALFRKCIEEYGMKGLKWHPDMGYYPNSPEAYSVLKVADELGVPLLTHTGPLEYTRAKYAHPIHLDDIALDFPNISIIAAHMGDMWWRDWAALSRQKKNIYGDLALWQPLAASNPESFRRYLREILDIVGPGQILFASDGPFMEPVLPNSWWVSTIKDLELNNPDGIKFSIEEIDAILGGNAKRIFKL